MIAGKSRPWRMLAPLAGVFLLFAAWSGYWLFAFNLAQRETAKHRAGLAARDITLACLDESWSGYPFRIEFTCRAPVFDGNIRNYAVNIRAAALLIVAQAYNPYHVVALLDGPTSIAASGGSRFEASHDRAIASYRYTGADCGPFAMEIPALAVPGAVEASLLALHLRCNGNEANIAVNASGLTVYGAAGGPVRLDSAALLVQAKPSPDALLAGARAEILSAEIARDGVVVKGKGWLGLDRQRRLSGTIATETNDIDGLLGEASNYRPLSEADRAALKTLLGLIGASAADKRAKADFIAKDGELYWGPFKLADLPPLY